MGAYGQDCCGEEILLGVLKSANLNTGNDQTIDIGDGTKQITRITTANPSGTTNVAAGGVYTGVVKTGTDVVAAAQTYAALTATNTLDLTINKNYVTASQVYFSLTTPQGAACTIDIYVYGKLLP